jgi:hypothetical protein
LVALVAWLGGFFWSSKDCCQTRDELKVLQREFGLNEAQTARIRELQEGYAPKCAALCQRVAEAQAEWEEVLARPQVSAAEIQDALQKTLRLRYECQAAMLEQVGRVSQEIPASERHRFLQTLQRRLVCPGMASE